MQHDGERERTRIAIRADLVNRHAVSRTWAADHTLWQDDPSECANRLGWLDEPDRAAAAAATLVADRARFRAQGRTHVVWCGMGGSSLFPELLASSPLPRSDGLALTVMDTSHPAAVARVAAAHDPATTLYVFASKSGTTLETRSHLDFFTANADGGAFAVVTDPGSDLDALATQRGWTRWTANPEIGGRFAAISHFGMVAAALVGIDPASLAASATDLAARCRSDHDNPALDLAVYLAVGARTGRDKLTLVTPPTLHGLGAWVEQLVAESTGKQGVGLLPVVDEPLARPDEYGPDRMFVTYGDVAGLTALRAAGHPVFDLGPAAAAALGGELMRWELATAWVGAALGINPFDQPDVEAAKRAAGIVLAGGSPPVAPGDADAMFATLRPGDHVVVQAFVDPTTDTLVALEGVRLALRTRLHCAVTVGIGPRYLHSTGQLHKGGPNTGVFVQVVEPGSIEIEVPGRGFGFGALLMAQADGDHAALLAAGRRVARVSLADALALA